MTDSLMAIHAALSEAITTGIDAHMTKVHTALPGVISTFDPDSQTAEVFPAMHRVFTTQTSAGETQSNEPLPLLVNVKVIFMRSGGYCVTHDVNPGDGCLLVFCERDISRYVSEGAIDAPPRRRFHSLSDAVAIMGFTSVNNAIQSFDVGSLTIRDEANETRISLREDKTIEITTPKLEINGDVTVTGNLELSGDASVSGSTELSSNVTSAGVNIGSTHVHTQPPDSGGDAQPPTGVPQ